MGKFIILSNFKTPYKRKLQKHCLYLVLEIFALIFHFVDSLLVWPIINRDRNALLAEQYLLCESKAIVGQRINERRWLTYSNSAQQSQRTSDLKTTWYWTSTWLTNVAK